jgi:hypothetical protein
MKSANGGGEMASRIPMRNWNHHPKGGRVREAGMLPDYLWGIETETDALHCARAATRLPMRNWNRSGSRDCGWMGSFQTTYEGIETQKDCDGASSRDRFQLLWGIETVSQLTNIRLTMLPRLPMRIETLNIVVFQQFRIRLSRLPMRNETRFDNSVVGSMSCLQTTYEELKPPP